MARIEIRVPGKFRDGSALLDLETVKVPTGGFRMRNGEILRNRWSIAMAGVALDGVIGLIDADGDERYALGALADEISTADEVVYGATREFDEMICKGRFTNARRAHESIPFFPAVPEVNDLSWRNVGTEKSAARRSSDCPSRDVPTLLRKGGQENWLTVTIHLLRDVADLILVSGDPDAECARWCRNVLASWGFAKSEILGRSTTWAEVSV